MVEQKEVYRGKEQGGRARDSSWGKAFRGCRVRLGESRQIHFEGVNFATMVGKAPRNLQEVHTVHRGGLTKVWRRGRGGGIPPCWGLSQQEVDPPPPARKDDISSWQSTGKSRWTT